jgi:hypothetical protein
MDVSSFTSAPLQHTHDLDAITWAKRRRFPRGPGHNSAIDGNRDPGAVRLFGFHRNECRQRFGDQWFVLSID